MIELASLKDMSVTVDRISDAIGSLRSFSLNGNGRSGAEAR